MAEYTQYEEGAPKPKSRTPETAPSPRIVTVEEGVPIQLGGTEGSAVRVVHPSNPTARSERLGITMLRIPPKAVLPTSAHEAEECYTILEGEGLMTFADSTQKVEKGDFVYLPPGCEHAIENTGSEILVALLSASPPTP